MKNTISLSTCPPNNESKELVMQTGTANLRDANRVNKLYYIGTKLTKR
jgi:hypothetical protein